MSHVLCFGAGDGRNGRRVEASISVLCLCKEWQYGVWRAEESGNVGTVKLGNNQLICGMQLI